jgi:hypothetical protein
LNWIFWIYFWKRTNKWRDKLARFILADALWRLTPSRRPPPPSPTFCYIIPSANSFPHSLTLSSHIPIHSARTMKNQTAQICLIAVASFYLFMKLTPSIPQPQMYHDFADKREFFGNSSFHFLKNMILKEFETNLICGRFFIFYSVCC